MEERDLLALLHRGGRELRTVRLAATSQTDSGAVAKAHERWSRERGSAGTAVARAVGPERERFVEETTRLWLERPDKLREETEGAFPRYGVRVGDTWWLYTEHQGAITNNGARNHHSGLGQQFELLLEPAPLLPYFDFEILGAEQQAGRPTIRVHALRRPARDRPPILFPLPLGYEEYEFNVDREHGTVLRMRALFAGEAGVDIRIDEIAYDEPIAPETFVFEPPEGETLEDVTKQRHLRDEPIEEVARRASFTVFIVTGLEGVWRLRALHLRKGRAQPHEHVHLAYYRDDATHSFGINEQPADAPQLFTGIHEAEAIERKGVELHVIRPTDSRPLGSVRLTRNGTSIEITSDNLTVEQLLEIADSLQPAPRA